MTPDKREQLYDNLIGSGRVSANEIGSKEAFMNAIKDEASARQFHANLLNSGLFNEQEIGSADDFYGSISSDFAIQAKQQTAPAGDAAGTAAEQQVQSPVVKVKPEKKEGGVVLTDEEKQRMLAETRGIVEQSKAYLHQFDNRLKYLKGNRGLQVKPVKLGESSRVVETEPKLNPETGQLERTYITESGNEYKHRELADLEENRAAQQRHEASLEGQLEAAYKERDRLKEVLAKDEGPGGLPKDWGTMMYQAGHGVPVKHDEDYENNRAALRAVEKRIRVLEDERDDAGFWSALGKDLGTPESWSFGLVDIADASRVYRAVQSAALTESGRNLVENTLSANEAEERYSGNRGAWYRAGKASAYSIQLIPDFLLGMGEMKAIADVVTKGVVKGGTKALTKALSKEAAEKAFSQGVLKATGVTLGTLAAGAGMVNSIQLPRLGAQTMQNLTDELTIDDNGEYVFGHYEENETGERQFVSDDHPLNALLKAEQSLIPEAASEVLGEFLPGAGAVLDKFGLSKISGWLNRLSGTKWYRNYSRALERTGFHGVPGRQLRNMPTMPTVRYLVT